MNATPEKVCALTQLLTDAAPAVASQGYDLEDLAHRLLQNGVTVEVPEPGTCRICGSARPCSHHGEWLDKTEAPAPTYQPGDVVMSPNISKEDADFKRAVREVMERQNMSEEDARAALVRLADAVRELAPRYHPGSVAIATVHPFDALDQPNLLVVRQAHGWYVPAFEWDVLDSQVTVTSRAVVVTEADRDELYEAFRVHVHAGFALRRTREVIDDWFAERGLNG